MPVSVFTVNKELNLRNMQLRVPYVNTVDNLADFFTKPLAKNDYFRMRDILMNVPPADRIAVSRERKTLVRGGRIVSFMSTTGGC
jgi:hypothetical protein